MRRVPDSLIRLLIVAAVVIVWEGAVRFFGIAAFILPAPSSIAVALWRGIVSTLYLDHIGITVAETLLASQRMEFESENTVNYMCNIPNVKRMTTSFRL